MGKMQREETRAMPHLTWIDNKEKMYLDVHVKKYYSQAMCTFQIQYLWTAWGVLASNTHIDLYKLYIYAIDHNSSHLSKGGIDVFK